MRPFEMRGLGMRFIDPAALGIELLYSAIVIILCLIIYFKTKELYSLTKHKGISYFRNTFLFFALAYVLRFTHTGVHLSGIVLDFKIPLYFMPISLMIIAYVSSMVIISLTLSTSKKILGNRSVGIIAQLLAITISLLVLVFRSPYILFTTQIGLLISAIVLSTYNLLRKSKKNYQSYVVYFLLFIFWIINLSALVSPKLFLIYTRIPIYMISLFIFSIIFYKVAKWTK